MKFQRKSIGFILKKTLVKDTGAFFEIFTKEDGKKSFFIYNIKKAKNIKPAYLALGSEVEINYSIKNKIPVITELKLLNSLGGLDFEKLNLLSYFLELTCGLLASEQVNFHVYKLLDLVFLNFSSVCNLRLKLFFEIRSLTGLGFIGDLNCYSDSGEKIDLKSRVLKFNLIEGGVSIDNGNKQLTITQLKILYFFQIGDLKNIVKLEIKKEDFDKIKNLFNFVISSHSAFKLKTV